MLDRVANFLSSVALILLGLRTEVPYQITSHKPMVRSFAPNFVVVTQIGASTLPRNKAAKDELLLCVAFALNSTPLHGRALIQFFLFYGRQALSPSDIALNITHCVKLRVVFPFKETVTPSAQQTRESLRALLIRGLMYNRKGQREAWISRCGKTHVPI